MSKILIAYYSLGGTTARVADSIAVGSTKFVKI